MHLSIVLFIFFNKLMEEQVTEAKGQYDNKKFCLHKWEPLIIQGIVSKFHFHVNSSN